MTTTVKTTSHIIDTGGMNVLREDDVENFEQVLELINDIDSNDPCTFVVDYDDNEYTGTITTAGVNNTELRVIFDQSNVVLPSGVCMAVTCYPCDCDGKPDHTHCYENNITPVTANTRLLVLDNSGCPDGFVTMSQILDFIQSELDIPTSLCELLGVSQIPQGGLTASDRILVTSGLCDLKSVPQSDVLC